MIDIKLIRENKELVKENIKKKFQDEKLPLVDDVYELDKEVREVQVKMDSLKAEKNKLSGQIGLLMKDGKKEEAEKIKQELTDRFGKLDEDVIIYMLEELFQVKAKEKNVIKVDQMPKEIVVYFFFCVYNGYSAVLC